MAMGSCRCTTRTESLDVENFADLHTLLKLVQAWGSSQVAGGQLELLLGWMKTPTSSGSQR
jgi:hypothetical protein